MVVLHIKNGDESLFLLETKLTNLVEDIIAEIIAIHNGRLKTNRICYEMELLCEHGPSLPPEMHGLLEDQIKELKLSDEWQEKYSPETNTVCNKDPCNKRNGLQPSENSIKVIKKTIEEAKGIISNEQVKSGVCLTKEHIQDALDILKGAIMIAYPMKLPYYDPISCELENRENLAGTQDLKVILEPALTQLWFASKELQCGKMLHEYFGRNEKTKVIVKVQKRGRGAPGREPLMTEAERKSLMLAEFNRREKLKKLNEDDDDSYLDSNWADPRHLQKTFHGLGNISWKPK